MAFGRGLGAYGGVALNTGDQTTLSLTNVEHRCTVYCRAVHEFGNIYRCESSGRRHVCDANCDQKCMHGDHQTRCVLSGKVYPAPKELLARLRRKRGMDEQSCGGQDAKRSFRAPVCMDGRPAFSYTTPKNGLWGGEMEFD